jgi:hypothetical protein
MQGQQLSPDQIKASFAICARPIKLLIREYFVQFSKGTAKFKNGEKVSKDKIPKEYVDQGKIMEMVTGENKAFDFNSLLNIPNAAGHLSVWKKEDDEWTLDLTLGGHKRKFDMKKFEEFKEGGMPTPEDAHRRAMELMMGFYPSARVVFDYLRKKNSDIMQTIALTYNPGTSTIVISDNRFPNLRAGKVLYVKLQAKK